MIITDTDDGFNSFREEVSRRSKLKGPTTFRDFESFLPKKLVPNPSIYYPEFTFEAAKLTVIFFAFLKFCSTFEKGESKSSTHRRVKFVTIELMKYYVDNLIPSGKIQTESGQRIRFDLDRKMSGKVYRLEHYFVKHLGPDRIKDPAGQFKRTSHNKYKDRLFDIIKEHGIEGELQFKVLNEIWNSIKNGKVPYIEGLEKQIILGKSKSKTIAVFQEQISQDKPEQFIFTEGEKKLVRRWETSRAKTRQKEIKLMIDSGIDPTVCYCCKKIPPYGEYAIHAIEMGHKVAVGDGVRQTNIQEDKVPLCRNCHGVYTNLEGQNDWSFEKRVAFIRSLMVG